jgi:tetratricopeptide (TPR) repeat protein
VQVHVTVLLACGICGLAFADVRSARALLEQGKKIEALKEMEAALRSAPDDPEVQFEIGELLREIGTERASLLQRMAPESAEAHELVGRSLESSGHLDEALAEYRSALKNNAGLQGVHVLIGNVLWKKRDFEAARPELEAELRLNPNHPLANLRLGEVLISVNEAKSALPYLTRAVQTNDSSIEAHRELGRAYRLLGDHRAALTQFRIVADRRPDDGSVHAQLAGEYRTLGDVDEAKAELAIHRRLLEAKASAGQRK